MTATTAPHIRREDGAPSNWDRYLDLLARRGVPEKFRRWYVRRVEDFLKAVRPGSLAGLSAEQVTGYVQEASSRPGLADWQFRQLVDALQLLLVDLAQVPAGKSVDWAHWNEGGRGLEADHSTIAKSSAPASGAALRPLRGAFSLLETLAGTIRSMQYSIRTEQCCVDWCHRFLAFCAEKDPADLGREDLQRFLSHLAVERSVSAKTQSLAYNAVAFLFKQVLERPLEDVRFSMTRRQARLPVVRSKVETRRLLAELDGTFGLMARLMYGTGMRLIECVRLRVADLDFDRRLIMVRDGKGGNETVSCLGPSGW